MTRIHMYTHTPHTTHHTHTAAQLDRGWPELWCGRQRLFTQLQERREGSEIEGVNEGELCRGQLPSPPHFLSLPLTPPCLSLPSCPPPSLLTPRDAHSLGIWGRTHSSLRECVFVYVDLWNGRTEQKRQTDRHACEVATDTASRYTSAFFFSLTLTFLLFFVTVFFSHFIWVFWFLVQKSY